MGVEGSPAALKYLLILFGAGALLLHILHSPSWRFGDPDEFVVVLASYAGFESRVVAGRASRQVHFCSFLQYLHRSIMLSAGRQFSGD